ncbi:hypothetical protein CALCODRAFT_299309 [Calocera cornea HHB12733]|uniref:Uncharacterized protein n=1 Tax=Calocera cornea HHB12733 TaxID=1353952 RepID=A0A165FJR3_9BASI|nr:hypothetical protein CALCODRAFT_299309 [Calocera cornea HHB12733]
MPGTPLPFTLPVSPPSSSSGPSFPATPDQPMSPGAQPAPRSIADRLSMLRQHGLQDMGLSETSHAGTAPVSNGKRISRETAKATTSPSSPTPSLPSHTGSSAHSRLSDIPSLLPSASILPSAPSSRPTSGHSGSPAQPSQDPRRPTPIQTESEFDNTFPTLSALEAQFPSMPSVPTELPGLPSVPGHRPSDSLSSKPPSRPESTSRPRTTPPPIPPKPISPHASGQTGASHGRPPSVSSVRSHPTGGRHNIPTSISPKELYDYLQYDTHSILLLDIRDQVDYLNCHIAIPPSSRSARVQLEPTLIDRPSLTSNAIESALSLNPPEEAAAFQSRAKYSIVVMCDEASTNLGKSVLMQTLVSVIWENEFSDRKKLDKPPIVLVGGLKAWRADLGEEGLEGREVGKKPRTNGRLPAIEERRPAEPHRERVEALREERGRSSLDQLPNRIWCAYAWHSFVVLDADVE